MLLELTGIMIRPRVRTAELIVYRVHRQPSATLARLGLETLKGLTFAITTVLLDSITKSLVTELIAQNVIRAVKLVAGLILQIV